MSVMTGEVVVVTGGARGIGAAVAKMVVAEGGSVVVGDVLDDEGQTLCDELGDAATYVTLDVTDPAAWDQAVSIANDTYGSVTGLVNNAGILAQGPIEDGDIAAFEKVIKVNVNGVFLGMRALAPAMRKAGHGSVVNLSSTAGLMGYAYLTPYVASKWAVRGMTKAAALELANGNIRVNSVHPGPIRTPMTSGIDDSIASGQPIPRFGDPDEVARMIVFLLSTQSSYSTGSEFVVDGGQVLGPVIEALRE
ncbi:MAG: glucose 1-dehydrogenase [Nitriliruptoraceae bacterium]